MSKRISVAWAKQLVLEGQRLVEEKANGERWGVTNASFKGKEDDDLITVYFA